MANQEYMEQEINLRGYINVIIKQKKIVLFVFIISLCVLIAMSLSKPKIYRATALIMISPSRIQNTFYTSTIPSDALNEKYPVKYTEDKPLFSISTHKQLLKSNLVLSRIINKSGLHDSRGMPLGPDDLLERFDIRETKDTDIIHLSVVDKDPIVAKNLANTWASEYLAYSQELILGEIKGTGEFITDQFDIAKQKLIKSEQEIKDFNDKYHLALMESELDLKKTKLNEYKKEMINSEIILKSKEDSLAQLKNELTKQKQFIVVSKAITDDALWQKERNPKNQANFDNRKLTSEQINPIYQDLKSRTVNTEIEINTLKPRLEYLKAAISPTEQEINQAEIILNQKKFELTQLSRQTAIYKRTYDTLSDKIEGARISKSIQLGEVKLVSPALEPKYPISSNKKRGIAVSVIFSMMLGLLSGFIGEYMPKIRRGK
jgi:polysaccharide biosynthesis transport protein